MHNGVCPGFSGFGNSLCMEKKQEIHFKSSKICFKFSGDFPEPKALQTKAQPGRKQSPSKQPQPKSSPRYPTTSVPTRVPSLLMGTRGSHDGQATPAAGDST